MARDSNNEVKMEFTIKNIEWKITNNFMVKAFSIPRFDANVLGLNPIGGRIFLTFP